MPFTLDDYGAYSAQKQYTCQFPSTIAIHAEDKRPLQAGEVLFWSNLAYCSQHHCNVDRVL